MNTQYNFYTTRLFILLFVFLFTGLALSFSLSYSFSLQTGRGLGDVPFVHANILKLFLKQLAAAAIGMLGLFAVLKVKTQRIRHISFALCVAGIAAMAITALWGSTINGARRWITVAGVSLQTGDFARIVFILCISHIFAQLHALSRGAARGASLEDPEEGAAARGKLIVQALIAGIGYIGALYFQHHYSSLVLSVSVLLLIVFSSDVRFSTKITALVVMLVGILFVIISNPNRMARIFMFFNPTADSAYNAGFQLSQSYEVMAQGGLFGRGVGTGMIEALSIPYFYNDFVFAVIVSEFGMLGAFFILGLFSLLFYYAYKICHILYYRNRFYFYVVFANTSFIVLSVAAHIAVTVGIVPTSGLNMPFYSTGGSSMITTLLLYGFILKGAYAADNKHLATPSASVKSASARPSSAPRSAAAPAQSSTSAQSAVKSTFGFVPGSSSGNNSGNKEIFRG